jgi:hypothetical protein
MRFTAAIALLAIGSVRLVAQASSPADAAQTPLPPATTSTAPAALPTAAAQTTPAAAPAASPQVNDTKIGFSYSLPAGWETQASAPAKPDVPYPTVEAPKKGNACAQVELTARQGTPFSVVVVVGLPFDCYGQTLTKQNMADFTAGASEGLKQTFDVMNPVLSSYTLGSHNMWVERASGTVKGQPESKYTLEVACTLLAKGAACWMTMAADAAHLEAFEQEPVTLGGDAFDAIVPANAIPAPAAAAPSVNKPS